MKIGITILGLMMLAASSVVAQWNQDESTFKIARLYHAGEVDKAEQAVQEHFRNDVHPLPDIWLLAGRILVAQGNMAKAIATLQRAVREFPRDHRLWSLLGEVRIRQGGEAEGVKALRKSLDIDAAYAPSYLWLAKASYGNPLQVAWLNKVLVLEPKDSSTAKEALAMLRTIEEKSKAQQTSPGDVLKAAPEK